MKLLDARRLTGPSLLFDQPAAILDVECEPGDCERIAELWRSHVLEDVAALGWPTPDFNHVQHIGGLSLAFTAPVDGLYSAASVNERAYERIAGDFGGEPLADPPPDIDTLRTEAAAESNPGLLALMAEAKRRKVSLLWDDDEVSLGLGRWSKTWPVRELPSSVDWDAFHDVPVGLVTGTNGKTTTVRLARHILQGAGLRVGISSTDWIAVDDRIIDRGDWSGPGGARSVLRQNDVDAAILECARGGLLRRGLGVESARAALITNISADHLGDFGSHDLDELLSVKWIVSQAVVESGVLVLNADDALLVSRSADYTGRLDWFGLNPRSDVIRRAVENGRKAFVLTGDVLSMRDANGQHDICKASEIPIAMGGHARHNIANALAAAALAYRLGASLDDIAAGLKSLEQGDNPGRCNLYDVEGRKVLVDFAHNPAAMSALFDIARAVPAERRVLCFGQAGDRPDALIEEMTRDAFAIGLDRVHVSELARYHRGRDYGDVYGVIRNCLKTLGMPGANILHFDEELDALSAALEWSREGDLLIMLALGGSAPIHAFLEERGATTP